VFSRLRDSGVCHGSEVGNVDRNFEFVELVSNLGMSKGSL
jgi:hypothetical protein